MTSFEALRTGNRFRVVRIIRFWKALVSTSHAHSVLVDVFPFHDTVVCHNFAHVIPLLESPLDRFGKITLRD